MVRGMEMAMEMEMKTETEMREPWRDDNEALSLKARGGGPAQRQPAHTDARKQDASRAAAR